MSGEELKEIDLDAFFRPRTEAEKAQAVETVESEAEKRRKAFEASGSRPLSSPGLSSSELEVLQAERLEMSALLARSDRPAVKARLSEFLLEMDNELARLRQDPLELDDEDRRELRLFHLRKMQLPGAVKMRRETGDAQYQPHALPPGQPLAVPTTWQEIQRFALDLGEDDSPVVTVDVRLEAVERLPKENIYCSFQKDSFDLQIVHALEGRRYRLRKTCLQRDIDADRSSFRVKRNHVVITLVKMSPHVWTDLCAPDRRSRNRQPKAA